MLISDNMQVGKQINSLCIFSRCFKLCILIWYFFDELLALYQLPCSSLMISSLEQLELMQQTHKL